MSRNKQAFTLIELLVVVLIIGILAAVALPQYRKAVMKSHFSEWAVYINSLDKAQTSWILANGYPDSTIEFTGDSDTVGGSLDVDIPCLSVSGYSCYTKIGRFHAACASSSCYIDFGADYNGGTGPFPTGNAIWTSKYADGSYYGQRVLVKVPTDKTFRKIVCEWWATHYGKDRMKEDVVTDCAEVGI
ncbi:MAG: prepilin-type N-terminal cleavage/methylation domain-containing protein [Elusimicrobiaceae bacterium]|nr:prepilin-type N-terminal cleavage/methylation domain-containing protein [Elusimicrobiaceae bacterium]